VPLLFLSGELWEEEVRCTAKVVDGYSAIAGAHRRHVTTSSSWSPPSSPMWWWSCCFGGLENSGVLLLLLQTATALAALVMMKTFVHNNKHGQFAFTHHNPRREKSIRTRPKCQPLSRIRNGPNLSPNTTTTSYAFFILTILPSTSS